MSCETLHRGSGAVVYSPRTTVYDGSDQTVGDGRSVCISAKGRRVVHSFFGFRHNPEEHDHAAFSMYMCQILMRITKVNIGFFQDVSSAMRLPSMHGVLKDSVLGISGGHLIEMHAVMFSTIRFSDSALKSFVRDTVFH
jgi:hypothetical protein